MSGCQSLHPAASVATMMQGSIVQQVTHLKKAVPKIWSGWTSDHMKPKTFVMSTSREFRTNPTMRLISVHDGGVYHEDASSWPCGSFATHSHLPGMSLQPGSLRAAVAKPSLSPCYLPAPYRHPWTLGKAAVAQTLSNLYVSGNYQVWIDPISVFKCHPEGCVAETVQNRGVHIILRASQVRCSVA